MKTIHVTEGKVLVEPNITSTSLGNGLQINNETQSRKDIATGKVIDGKYEGAMVYFPLYAANTLMYEGINYLILDERDILAIENDSTDN